MEPFIALALLTLLVAVFGLLAARYGADSRLLDERDRRGWWPN